MFKTIDQVTIDLVTIDLVTIDLVTTDDLNLPCNGIIIFRKKHEILETILVTSRKGKYGFPKGKRKFKKGETQLQAAFREVQEETGLLPEDLKILTDKADTNKPVWLIEPSLKQKPSIGLMVGFLQQEKDLTWDPEELQKVEWHSVDEAMNYPEEQFYSKRKIVLQKAIELIKFN